MNSKCSLRVPKLQLLLQPSQRLRAPEHMCPRLECRRQFEPFFLLAPFLLNSREDTVGPDDKSLYPCAEWPTSKS